MKIERVRKVVWLVVLALGWTASVVGQGVAQDTPPPPVEQSAVAEHRISEAEAREFFRSVDDILKFASEHTGLPILHPVKKKLATREEVSKVVEKRMKEQGNGERFDHTARSLKKLGLLPPEFNFREYMLGLYKEQVEGWYDAHSKTVYLLDWVEPELQKPVMAHELVHALQDQSYDLDKWLNVTKDSNDDTGQMIIDEQRAARQSIVEGQAMVVLYDYQMTSTGQTVETAPGLVDSMRSSITDEDANSMYGKAPIYLREALLFPYTFGTDFVVSVLVKRGKHAAFAGVLEHPPLDTHQIMEPTTYLSGEPQMSVKVVALEKVLGPGWRREDFSGIGEVDLRVFVRQWSGDKAAAKLSPTWRGGYYMALVNKKAAKDAPLPLVLVVNFANPQAAAQFAAIYEAELPKRYKSVVAAKVPQKWTTEEGEVELYVEGSSVIALESFTAVEAAKLHDALIAAVKHPVEIPAALVEAPARP
jgi:hypothetical protein